MLAKKIAHAAGRPARLRRSGPAVGRSAGRGHETISRVARNAARHVVRDPLEREVAVAELGRVLRDDVELGVDASRSAAVTGTAVRASSGCAEKGTAASASAAAKGRKRGTAIPQVTVRRIAGRRAPAGGLAAGGREVPEAG
jgi:hypothetical protein